MYKNYIKRIMDFIFSLLLFPVFIISFIVVAPIILIIDGYPVFYNSSRRGLNGKSFMMYKYRSMKKNAPDIRNADGSTYNGENDIRVTTFGKVLRKLSIDEIPQLINILKGDMSFIGPRPNLSKKRYEDLDTIRKKRLSVRPGITGYSQAYFRNSITQEEKYKNDCIYIDNISFRLDFQILLKTIQSVILRKNIYIKSKNKESFNSNEEIE